MNFTTTASPRTLCAGGRFSPDEEAEESIIGKVIVSGNTVEDRGRALAPQERELILRLSSGVLSARPLIDVLEAPVHVAGGGADSAAPGRLLYANASGAGAAPVCPGAAAFRLTLLQKDIRGPLRAHRVCPVGGL